MALVYEDRSFAIVAIQNSEKQVQKYERKLVQFTLN